MSESKTHFLHQCPFCGGNAALMFDEKEGKRNITGKIGCISGTCEFKPSYEVTIDKYAYIEPREVLTIKLGRAWNRRFFSEAQIEQVLQYARDKGVIK